MSTSINKVKPVVKSKTHGQSDKIGQDSTAFSPSSVTGYIKKHWFWLLVNVGVAWPLCKMLWQFASGALIDPVGEMTNVTGYTGLVLLVLSLACTPLLTLTGFRKVNTVRKSLGLWGFAYITMHMLIFIGLDYGFNLDFILGDAVLSKRYVIVGFAAFLLLLPLAVTSTKWWMKRLGRNWKKLHRLTYMAVPLGALHYIWVQKVPVEPVVWATVIGLLLLARVQPVRKKLQVVRQRFDQLSASKQAAA